MCEWEGLINFEQDAFEEGRKEGVIDAQKEGIMHHEGLKAGFLKGFAVNFVYCLFN